jgi:hypothetical protein
MGKLMDNACKWACSLVVVPGQGKFPLNQSTAQAIGKLRACLGLICCV